MPPESLSEKIKRLKKSLPSGVVTGGEMLKRQAEKEPPDLSRFIAGDVYSSEHGTCFVTDETIPFSDFIGHYSLERLRHLSASQLIDVFNLPCERETHSERIVFLDTETTGLAGGTGSYAFQVGLGWLEEEGFRVLQCFMRDYDEESAQMAYVGEMLERCGALVTYNGQTFDLPLLRTRFLFNRVRLDLDGIPHLDLLPVARRLWKRAYGAANLSHLEECVLGNTRDDDIPGALIPTLYFQFLRGASPRTLVPVFHHNRMDIVALAALTEYALRCHTAPETIANPWERYGVSVFLMKRNRLSEAAEILEPVLNRPEKDTVWHMACRFAGFLYKRQGDFHRAAGLWWEIYHHGSFDPPVLIELAKHLEHREKDYSQALRLVEEVFEGYGTEPEPVAGGGSGGWENGDWSLEYDYSESAVTWRDSLPVRNLEGDLVTVSDSSRIPIPRLTDRFREDLNRRYHRLRRKLGC